MVLPEKATFLIRSPLILSLRPAKNHLFEGQQAGHLLAHFELLTMWKTFYTLKTF